MERVELHLAPPDVWPDQSTRDYLLPLWTGPLQRYVANLRTELGLAVVGGLPLPLTVPEPWPGNSYLCSPRNQYLGYTREVLSKSRWGWAGAGLEPLMRWMSPLDQVVQVNNWLLSTNLYPKLDVEAVPLLHQQLRLRFPQRALLFRSLDRRCNPQLLAALQSLGYLTVFSRLVFYKDPSLPWSSRDTVNDLKLAAGSGLGWRHAADWRPADFERAAQLYRQLYIDKYTALNPQFSADFLRLVYRSGWTLLGLFGDDRMEGVIGFVQRAGVMTTPILGYDTGQPQKLGLYRLLTLRIAQEGRERGLLVHESAGVGRFKRLRGAVAEPEFNLVYVNHLPWPEQARWRVLQALVNGPGRRLVEWWER